MAALTTEFIAGKVFSATLRAYDEELCPTLTAKLPFIRIFSVAFWAFHLCSPKTSVQFLKEIPHIRIISAGAELRQNHQLMSDVHVGGCIREVILPLLS